jgi:DNA polymerase-3 subunit delta
MPAGKDVIDKIKRYYLFYGSNDFKKNERVSSLIKAVIPQGGEAFDLDRFEGRRCDVPALINCVSTPPVMGPLRVVVLNDIDKLPSKGQKMLAEFLGKIPEYSVLAMTAAKADKRSNLFKKLMALNKKQSFNYGDLKSSEASTLVIEFAARRKKEIDIRIADMLVSIFGNDPYRLENEVEKLALFTGEKNTIEKKDLAFAAGFSRIETPYDLPDLVFSGQLTAALELTSRALMSGISEMQILYIFKNHLTRICASLISSDIKEIMKKGHMPYYAAKQLMAQSRRINPAALMSGFEYIFRAEYALKSGRINPEIIIESLVLSLFLAVSGNNIPG